MIYKSLRKHHEFYGEIRGAVTTIGMTTTKTEYWNLKLWLREESDRRTYPSSESYFWMLMDWTPGSEEVSKCT